MPDFEVTNKTSSITNNLFNQALENDKQTIIDRQNEHILYLENKIKKLKEKEQNENKTLEEIIQKVEKNLVDVTKRAAESERTVEKMKLEIKQLKSQLATVQVENQSLKLAQSTKTDEKHKKQLNDFVCQLNATANNAESSLKVLLNGCDQLRLIAQCIDSFGKISELNSSENKSNSLLDEASK